jgi:MFS family permease
MPALWILSTDYLFLIFAQALGGMSWAIYELGMNLSFFEGVEEKKRTSILSCFSFANAIAMTVGTLIGGKILSAMGPSMHSYYVLFVISTFMRAASLSFLRGMPNIRTGFRMISSKVLAVRPTMGAFDKPVVSTIQKDKKRPESQDGQK